MCPNSPPAPPGAGGITAPRSSSPWRPDDLSPSCSKEKGVCVHARAAPATSRASCRSGFRGMQHLASCESEPDVRRPDVGQAPLGGGCTGGSHNLIVRPNPEHITLEDVHRPQHCHKKRPQGEEKKKEQGPEGCLQASDTLCGVGTSWGESLDWLALNPGSWQCTGLCGLAG